MLKKAANNPIPERNKPIHDRVGDPTFEPSPAIDRADAVIRPRNARRSSTVAPSATWSHWESRNVV
jgi:hypothetical protein